MYFDGEETGDTFTLHNPTRENQGSVENLEHEIEKLNIEISKLQNECVGVLNKYCTFNTAREY